MEFQKAIAQLNDLIRLDVDAVRAYSQAIEACAAPHVREKLGEFQRDHERHVEDLSAEVRKLGGVPEVTRTLKGFFMQAFTSITAQGDHSALVAMRANEEVTQRTYRSALDEPLGESASEVVKKNHADEQRHLAWIKAALDTRAWERAA
jgi:uncharacterized protein (TIGR02284 family)